MGFFPGPASERGKRVAGLNLVHRLQRALNEAFGIFRYLCFCIGRWNHSQNHSFISHISTWSSRIQ